MPPRVPLEASLFFALLPLPAQHGLRFFPKEALLRLFAPLARVVSSSDKRCVTKLQTYAAMFLAEPSDEVSGAGAQRNEDAALEGAIRERIEAGQRAWPDLTLAPEIFVRHLASHAARDLPPLANIGDFYLACACAHRVPGAAAVFQREYAEVIASAVRRVDASPAFIDEAGQVLCEKLLTAPAGATPKIAEYAGRAALRSWLSVTGARTALNLRRNKADRGHDELASGVGAVTAAAPELDYLKRRYKPAFEAALRVALENLEAKDRTLLRLHLGDGLSIDRIGTLYRVGRSTAARWLARARMALLDETRQELVRTLHITPSEFESIAALVRSDLDVSVVRLLATSSEKDE